MNHTLRPARNAMLPASLAIAAIAIAGCGGDDDGDGGDGDGGAGGAPPAKLAIEATGSGKAVKYAVPPKADSGATEIAFTNSTSKEAGAQLIRVRGDRHNDKQVLAEAQKVTQGQPVADWFKAAGGVGPTAPGETNTVGQALRDGTYYVIGDAPTEPLTKFTVAGGDGETGLPAPDARITAKEYAFETGRESVQLEPGESQIQLANAGKQWHHFIAHPIAEGQTIADVKKFFQTEQGAPPFDEQAGFESAVLEGGFSQQIAADLPPGNYAFICFVSDKGGGPPHVQEGMVSEITIQAKEAKEAKE